jgi:hypothetical protein
MKRGRSADQVPEIGADRRRGADRREAKQEDAPAPGTKRDAAGAMVAAAKPESAEPTGTLGRPAAVVAKHAASHRRRATTE